MTSRNIVGKDNRTKRAPCVWPADNKTANFEDLTDPVLEAIKAVYKLTPKDYGDRVAWNGLPLPESMAAICLPYDDLTRERLEYEEEDQGREPLEVLVGIAVQLGIEQGRRCVAESYKTWEIIEQGWMSVAAENKELKAQLAKLKGETPP